MFHYNTPYRFFNIQNAVFDGYLTLPVLDFRGCGVSL